MAKKSETPGQSDGIDPAVEERVRQMLDPSVPDPAPAAKPTKNKIADRTTAPEIGDLPVPDQPLKIKIIHDTDTPEPPAGTSTAPLLKDVPAKIEKAKKDLADTPPPPPQPEEKPAPTTKAPDKEPDIPELTDDEQTAKAVDDIIATESDELLAAQDGSMFAAQAPEKSKKKPGKLGRFLRSKRFRWTLIFAVLLGIAAAAVVPTSRYYVLNAAGVRASTSVTVLDASTYQPLKNVRVSAGGVSGTTDTEGTVRLEKLRLGPTQLVVEKRAFAPQTKNVTIGWGSNPLADMQLTPVGTQYAFVLTDYLSGKGVDKAEAVSGDASAVSDEQGKLKLTMDEPPDQIEITLTADTYRTEKFTIDADSKEERQVKLVPARKHVFISKRSGTYDVYKVDIDGKHEEKVLAGTGSEREDMVLIPHPSKEVAAMVSARGNRRNGDGYLMNTLTVLDLDQNQAKTVTVSERVQLVDWVGDRIVYVQVVSGESASSPKRHRLMSYDPRSGDNRELATSNYFNDVMVAAGRLYYAPSSTYQPEGVNTNVFRSDGNGDNKQIVLQKEAWNLFRTAYDHIALSVPNEWYDYKLGEKQPTKLDSEPSNLTSRVYVDRADGKKSLWVDTRDGKGALLVYDVDNKKDDVVRAQSGLKNPVRWLNNNTVVYRVKTDQETADYALSLQGGEPKKVRDVTNTNGVDTWYYY